jgi:hypothetical protein
VVGKPGETALAWWASLAQARASRARSDGRAGKARDPAVGGTPHPLGTRLAGPAEPLTLLTSVRPGTLAVVLRAGRLPEVRQPGAILVPPLVTRTPEAVQVLPISTAPVHLDVTVTDLISLDGHPVDPVRLRLRLQLDASDPAALVALVTTHGAGLEPALLGQVQREAVTAVRGAVAVNRRADLKRLGLQRVLQDRWLPRSFAGGALLCRGSSVLPVPSGDRRQDGRPPVVPADAAAAEATADAAPMAAP